MRHLAPATGNSSPVIYARFDVARIGKPDGGEGDWRRYQSAVDQGEAAIAAAQARVFLHNLRCLRDRARGCHLR